MMTVLNLSNITMKNISQVGGKNASLGEMIHHLSGLGIKVPHGFVTTADAYYEFLAQNNLDKKTFDRLTKLDVTNIADLKKVSAEIRHSILDARLPKQLVEATTKYYQELKLGPQQTVAVRSSATAEDLPDASFAGQQETFLNVSNLDGVLESIKRVYASLFTNRAIVYRTQRGFDHSQVAISVGVQKMIRSDLASSGVVFTIDTETGFDQVVFITASYGLGETVVQGIVNPDEFYVHKPTLQQKKKAIISRKLGSKMVKMIYGHGDNGKNIVQVDVTLDAQAKFCLSDEDVLQLAEQALIIENHYGKPMDIEWAKDGIENELYIIQARPETVKARESHHVIEQYRLKEVGKRITVGRSIGQRIGSGMARLIKSPKQMNLLKKGEVLVTDMTDPDWEPIMKKSTAIVTNRGGRTCHAAIVARELGIPAVVGCGDATEKIKNDQNITVSCAEGETGTIYEGLLDFAIEKTEINKLPELPVKLCINLANPEQAFTYQFLPNHGVGLARLEFIIGNMISIHPNALLHFNDLSRELQDDIKQKTAAYVSPVEFYIEKLTEGIATIAAAFYPKPIIVRFSDFKTNEYANLLGGDKFEFKEENPMLGYRGASRYLSGNFRECFILECQAIKRVREIIGLRNTHVMFPFVRTVKELQQLVALLKTQGLQSGVDELKINMMCEIPSNALLVEDFLAHVDGFSIGSNDLTQLALGLDRDSELIADLFDERDAAIKALLRKVITTCRKMNKYVGICGEGPSNHIDFAEWLMNEGIESISLSADSIVQTWMTLAKSL